MAETDSSQLVMTQGPQPGQTFKLDQDSLTLGRDPNNDIVISDPQVSRKHTRIVRQGNLMVIEDMGSTNGTFVNGVRLTGPHALANGDVVGLGDVVTLTYYGASITTTEPLGEHPTVSAAPPSYAPPPPPSPVPSAGPPPAYADVSPPAYAAALPVAEPVEETKTQTWRWVGCGCLGLALACIVVGLFTWFAPESFWQALIDFGIPVPTWPF